MIDPKVLYYEECWFFEYNAASKQFKNINKEHYSVHVFEKMFAHKVRTPYGPITRPRTQDAATIPTSNQAEIIINKVSNEFIISMSSSKDIIPNDKETMLYTRSSKDNMVVEKEIEFTWFPGFAVSQNKNQSIFSSKYIRIT